MLVFTRENDGFLRGNGDFTGERNLIELGQMLVSFWGNGDFTMTKHVRISENLGRMTKTEQKYKYWMF